PLLLEIFQPMLFCQSGLRFRDNAIAFVVESPGDGELEVLLLAFEVPLPFSQREFGLSSTFEISGLRIQFFLQRREFLSGLLLRLFARVLARALDFIGQPALVFLLDRRLDLRAQRASERNLLAAGRAGN